MIAVRGAELAVAKEIVSIIATEIVTVSKNYAGITMRFEEEAVNGGVARKWWELSPQDGGVSGSGSSGLQSGTPLVSFYSNGVVKVQEMVEKLEVALWSCGGSLEDVEEAFALPNPQILQSFELHRALVTTKHVTAPSLFKKDH